MQRFQTTFKKDHLHQGVIRNLVSKSVDTEKKYLDRLIVTLDELISNSIKYNKNESFEGSLDIKISPKQISCIILENTHISLDDFKKIKHHSLKHSPNLEDTGQRGLALFISKNTDLINFSRRNGHLRICFSIFT